MVVGDGLIATACKNIDRDDVLFFASGVSNSRETHNEAFNREQDLLARSIDNNKDKAIIYFGSYGGEDTPYLRHKEKMCAMVLTAKRHIVLKLSQVVGRGGNQNNLFNWLFVSLLNKEPIRAYSAERSLIDIDDVMMVLDWLIDNKAWGEHCLFKIEPLPVLDIIEIMMQEMDVDGVIEYPRGGGTTYLPDNTKDVNDLILPLREGYTRSVIKKYIS